MKRLKVTLLLILCILAACSKDEDPLADPRLAFAGNYESKEHIADGRTAGIHISVKPAHFPLILKILSLPWSVEIHFNSKLLNF